MVTINIAGVDHTTDVSPESLDVDRAMTNQVDSTTIEIVRKGGAPGGGYKPSLLDTVEILDGAQVLFGGVITAIQSKVVDASDIEVFTCDCVDYSFDMNRHLVTVKLTDMTIKAIIEYLRDNFIGLAYNTDNVVCSIVAETVAFNYEYPTACLQQLADLVNHDWYVDADKNIYFFAKGSVAAPFSLTDTSENYYYNTLELKENLANIRNTIIVRGGEYISDASSESQIADGSSVIYHLGDKYSDVWVTVDGVAKTVGTDFLHQAADYDVLYNYQERFIRFREDNKPVVGKEVEVGGLPHLPILVRHIDGPSITTYGEFESKIVDASIGSRKEARDRAQAELTAWASALDEGSFETMTAGLDVGQQITISSTIRGISQDYIISRINSRLVNGTQFTHKVTLVTTKTYGMVDFLMSLLTAQNKAIVIAPNEVFGVVRNLSDTMTMTDSIATPRETVGPYLLNTEEFNRYKKTITIDHTKVGSGGVTDFPVLLDLSTLGSAFFSHVKADGSDIRVTTSDGITECPLEVVAIDTGAEAGELFFKAPSLSDTVDSVFYIYYGNPDATAYAASDPSYGSQQVWADYEVVYHFESNGNDATANAKTLTNNGMVYGAEKIATGAYQDTNGDDFRTGGSYFTDPTIPRTTSLWVKTNMDTASRQVWRYRISATGNEAYRLYIEQNTGYPFLWMVDAGGVGASMIKPTVNVADGSPHKITVIYRSDTKVDMVVDGTLYSGSSTKIPRGSDQLMICDSSLGGGGGIHVDELRVVPEQKAIAWELTAYMNENSPATFYAVGAETEHAVFSLAVCGFCTCGS